MERGGRYYLVRTVDRVHWNSQLKAEGEMLHYVRICYVQRYPRTRRAGGMSN